MAMLRDKCPQCGKDAKMKYETPFGKKVLRAFTCGHTIFTEKDAEPPEPTAEELQKALEEIKIASDLKSEAYEALELDRFDDDGNVLNWHSVDKSFYSLDYEKCAYEYQQEGVRFIEKTNFRCLIADDLGLGKTIQAEIAVKRNPKTWPVLKIVKGATVLQWCYEFKDWVDNNPMGIMPIINRESIIPGFNFYVISMDFLSRKGVLDRLLKLGIKCLILDECQAYKDDSTARTKALFKLINDGNIQYYIGLSGTPIKNRAYEYFPILNLLDPQRWWSKIRFCRDWLEPNDKGIYTKIKSWRLDEFHRVTSQYILRREKRDVLKNLPPIRRNYVMVTIEDPAIKDIYNGELDLFQNFIKTSGKVQSTVMLGWLAKMRAIAGQAKVPWALDYIQEVMDNTDESLMLGIHHHSVRDTLYLATKALGYNPLKLSGEDDIFQKDRVQRDFNEAKNRLLIINMLAGGVGLNLQKACHHGVCLERLWNSADELQFEGRIDRNGQTYPVEFTYPLAGGTIDEWFHEMITEKRKMFHATMGDKLSDFDIVQDENFLKELVEKTLTNRLK